ncbi:MAG: hypothetical protein ACERKN_15490 [Velocimicrobium sp.]
MIIEKLRDQRYRITKQRVRIIDIILENDCSCCKEREWVERMTGAGANIIGGEGLICKKVPDDEILSKCKSLGKQMVYM